MYNSESMKWYSKHKRRLKGLRSIIESLLNQSHNKYSQDIICIKSCEESMSSWRVGLLYFFNLPSKDTSKIRLKSQDCTWPKN
jgi:hypothetical protein